MSAWPWGWCSPRSRPHWSRMFPIASLTPGATSRSPPQQSSTRTRSGDLGRRVAMATTQVMEGRCRRLGPAPAGRVGPGLRAGLTATCPERQRGELRSECAVGLCLETLLEDGVVGLAFLVAFFALALGAAARLAIRGHYEARTRGAAVAAACFAFAVSAAVRLGLAGAGCDLAVPAACCGCARAAATARARPRVRARRRVVAGPHARSAGDWRGPRSGRDRRSALRHDRPSRAKSQVAAALGDNQTALSYAQLAGVGSNRMPRRRRFSRPSCSSSNANFRLRSPLPSAQPPTSR